MEKLRWWESEGRERQRVNEAADELASLDDTAQGLRAAVDTLYGLDRDQARQIEQLQTTLAVVLDLLVERTAITAEELEERLRSARAAPEPAPGPPVVATVRCRSCQQPTPIRQTYMTDHGEVCGRCFQASQG